MEFLTIRFSSAAVGIREATIAIFTNIANFMIPLKFKVRKKDSLYFHEDFINFGIFTNKKV